MTATDLEVGDAVTVPGDMYGMVKFVGSVKGKSGKFVGVELDREFAARGKNDGDVDGTSYFRTSIPGAGIFLPIHRAEKRLSPGASSLDDFPLTPNTPSYSTGTGTSNFNAKFSQTVGHGVHRPSSPHFKPKRPSLPRPESPLRRQQPNLAPTPGRQLSASTRGGSRPGMPTTTPSKSNAVNMRASTTGSRPSTAHSQTPRPYSRTGSRMGNREEVGTAKTTTRNQSNGSVKSFSQPLRSQSRLGSAGSQEDEIQRLRTELAERDKRLAEQAANLADMDASVKELSGLLPPDGGPSDSRRPSYGGDDAVDGNANTSQLRQMLREKNEKITILTSEFDAHRADFRSTLDSLEMASTETERVYEEQKRDLLAQIAGLEDRVQENAEFEGSRKEFEDVANQLKGLEEFVQELEEGLEDARRGEAEARGEVEFLRGEVERGRSELRREREKMASVTNGGGGGREREMEDEIRGLKAIIHSFSTGGSGDAGGLAKQLEESEAARAKLEGEMEQLRRDLAASSTPMTNGLHHARNESELTTVAAPSTSRARADTVKKATTTTNNTSSAAEPSNGEKYCDMCESSEHDTLDCNTFKEAEESITDGGDGDAGDVEGGKLGGGLMTSFPGDKPAPLSLSPVKSRQGSVSKEEEGKENVGNKEEKWCALCEKDGHLAYECPDEQY